MANPSEAGAYGYISDGTACEITGISYGTTVEEIGAELVA